MNKVLLRRLFLILTISFAIKNSRAETIDCVSCPLSSILYQDLEISAGAAVSANSEIMNSIFITNHGTITGAISSKNVGFVVRNDGDLNLLRFDLFPDTVLRQYISRPSEMTGLDVNGGIYVPIIRPDFSGYINASDLILTFSGIKVFVQATNLRIAAYESELFTLADIISVSGSVWLEIIDYDGGALNLPSFVGTVLPLAKDTDDPMFNYLIDGGVTRKIRETDYTVILGKNDKKAVFLNNLRMIDPGNSVLKNLDSAETLGGLGKAMNKTMFFNPAVLMDGVLRMAARPDMNDPVPGFHIGGSSVFDSANSGVNFNIGYGDSFNAFFYAGHIAEDDNYKYGEAGVYGAGIIARFNIFGAGFKIFNADWQNTMLMSKDGGMKRAADGRLVYGFLEAAPDFGFVRPIFRLNYANSEVLGHSADFLYISYGAGLSFSEALDGIRTKYGAYLISGGPDARPDFGIILGSHIIEDSISYSVKLSPSNISFEIKAGF